MPTLSSTAGVSSLGGLRMLRWCSSSILLQMTSAGTVLQDWAISHLPLIPYGVGENSIHYVASNCFDPCMGWCACDAADMSDAQVRRNG